MKARAMTTRIGPTGAEAAELAALAAAVWAGSLLPAPSALDPTALAWPTALGVTLLGLRFVAAQRRWPALFAARRGAVLLAACLLIGMGGVGVYAYLIESWTCH